MDLAEIDDWIHNSNECTHINLLRPSKAHNEPKPVFEEPFHPKFTYPLFEEEESIIGYKDPRITLNFRANDLKPSFEFTYADKIDLADILPDKKQLDPTAVFGEHLPPSAFGDGSSGSEEGQKTSVVEQTLSVIDRELAEAPSGPGPTSSSWKPPGTLLHKFAHHGKHFEVWSSSLADPAARELWQNMQILVLLYIEGASPLELDEDWTAERWTLYLLYEVTPLEDTFVSPYTIAGFSTSHRYWAFPTFEVMRATKSLLSPPASSNGDTKKYTPPRLSQDPKTFLFTDHLNPLELPSRERISQYLILPPYQGQSLGAKLYETIFGRLVKQPNIFEIPIEDPNEEFDAMRDYSDITYLRSLPSFQAMSIATTIAPEKLRKDAPIPRDLILGNGVDIEALRRETKIVPRQFNRMVELHLLSTIPTSHRNTARITRKAKSSNEDDRKYYFWRLAIKERVYRQNADELGQIEDPHEIVEKLEAVVDEQEREYQERLDGLGRRAQWGSDEGDVASGGRHRREPPIKRKRVVVEDDEEDDWEDMQEEFVSSKKVRTK